MDYCFFTKVSEEEYRRDFYKLCHWADQESSRKLIHKIWEGIQLPERSTKNSAGYDFKMPFGITLSEGEKIVIPTGIRVLLNSNDFLAIFPRSGQGFKYRLSICNTVGIIDSDYFSSDNEGHIMIKICYDGATNNVIPSRIDEETLNVKSYFRFENEHEPLTINRGEKFAQGIIMPYHMITDDMTDAERNGGFGSTN